LKTAASIHAQDLRGFLQLLEDEAELARIESPIALNQEIGAVCLRNLQHQWHLTLIAGLYA
jgi:UbiD family decarboxylase